MTMRAKSTCAFLAAIAASACGTKFIDDVESHQMASSEGGGSTTDGPGQTVTSVGESEGANDSGGVEGCEPDPTVGCGPPRESQNVSLAPPSPTLGAEPTQDEFDCTVTALDYSADVAYVSLDCGLTDPVEFNSLMPEATYQKFAVDQALHIQYTRNVANNGGAAVVSIDAHPVFIVHDGGTLDSLPGFDSLGPFTVVAEEDVCLAPCVEASVCYSYAREQLTFTAGAVEATVWDAGQTTVTLDGSDYQIAVAVASGVVTVNPEAASCDPPAASYYSFHIADVTP